MSFLLTKACQRQLMKISAPSDDTYLNCQISIMNLLKFFVPFYSCGITHYLVVF